MEIESFKPQEYWSIDVKLKYNKATFFEAKGIEFNNIKIEKFTINSEEKANNVKKEYQNSKFFICDINSIPKRRKPLPPFLTSTLQQESNNRLFMGTQQTMSVAQKLYEKFGFEFLHYLSMPLSAFGINFSYFCGLKRMAFLKRIK